MGFISLNCASVQLIKIFCSGVHRPLRPRPPPDQAEDDQQVTSEEQLGEGKQTDATKVPQTNGDAAAGQRQRRNMRQRRQRNSESPTSKVSVTVALSQTQL